MSKTRTSRRNEWRAGVSHASLVAVCCVTMMFEFAAMAVNENSAPASGTLFVRSDAPGGGTGQSWNDAFNDLNLALDAAAASAGQVDEIWVAQGTYVPSSGSNPNDPRTRTFQLQGGVDVYGGFEGNETLLEQRDWLAHPTILSGDILGDDLPAFVNNVDNAFHVVSADRLETNAAGIDGFRITGGNAMENSANFGRAGGGLHLLLSMVSVRNCRIYENSSIGAGGGVFVYAGEVVVSNCDIIANRSHGDGAGLYCDFTVTVRDCAIRDNFTPSQSSGTAGLYVARDSLVISCVIEGNIATYGEFGGFEITERAWMINCSVVGNNALRGRAGGGGVFQSSRLVNSIIIGNVGSDSGGLYVAGPIQLDAPLISNSVIAFNEGDSKVGGIDIGGYAAPRVKNSIIWGNDAVAIPSLNMQIGGDVIPEIDASCVQYWDGSYGGTGNISDYPMFVDPFGPDGVRGTEDDDLRIERSSPCANTGYNQWVPRDAGDLDNDGDVIEPTPLDFANEIRFRCDLVGGSVGGKPQIDMGAHEYQPPPCIANFNGDCYLDIFDFLAYQSAFVSNDPSADLDHSTGIGIFDIFDFLTFQNYFTSGCP